MEPSIAVAATDSLYNILVRNGALVDESVGDASVSEVANCPFTHTAFQSEDDAIMPPLLSPNARSMQHVLLLESNAPDYVFAKALRFASITLTNAVAKPAQGQPGETTQMQKETNSRQQLPFCCVHANDALPQQSPPLLADSTPLFPLRNCQQQALHQSSGGSVDSSEGSAAMHCRIPMPPTPPAVPTLLANRSFSNFNMDASPENMSRARTHSNNACSLNEDNKNKINNNNIDAVEKVQGGSFGMLSELALSSTPGPTSSALLSHGFGSGYFRNANIQPHSYVHSTAATTGGFGAVLVPMNTNHSPNLVAQYLGHNTTYRSYGGMPANSLRCASPDPQHHCGGDHHKMIEMSPFRMAHRPRRTSSVFKNNNSIVSVLSESGYGNDDSLRTRKRSAFEQHHYDPHSDDAFDVVRSRSRSGMLLTCNNSLCAMPLSEFSACAPLKPEGSASGEDVGWGGLTRPSQGGAEAVACVDSPALSGSGGRKPWDGSSTMISIDGVDDLADIPLVTPRLTCHHALLQFCHVFCKLGGAMSIRQTCEAIQSMGSVFDECVPVIATLFVRLHQKVMKRLFDVLFARRQYLLSVSEWDATPSLVSFVESDPGISIPAALEFYRSSYPYVDSFHATKSTEPIECVAAFYYRAVGPLFDEAASSPRRVASRFSVPLPNSASERILAACTMLGTKLCSDLRCNMKDFPSLIECDRSEMVKFEYAALQMLGFDNLFVHPDHVQKVLGNGRLS